MTSEEDKIFFVSVSFSAPLCLPFWPGIMTGEKMEVADGGKCEDGWRVIRELGGSGTGVL
jgi:hypothetical protein